MTFPTLLLDEMIGPAVAQALRANGMDVVAVVESTELRSLPDEGVLEHAREHERVVVTRNISDFVRLDHEWRAEGRLHHGLVLVTERGFPQNRDLVGSLVRALLAAAEATMLPVAGDVRYLPPIGRTKR